MRKLISEKEKNTTKTTSHVISHRVRPSSKKRQKKQDGHQDTHSIWQEINYRTTEYPELERTHKDQSPAPGSTQDNPRSFRTGLTQLLQRWQPRLAMDYFQLHRGKNKQVYSPIYRK